MAISKEGVLHHQLTAGSVNSEVYSNFLRELLRWIGSGGRRAILMDNVSFHRSHVVNEVMRQLDFLALFIPPYSPEYNPIELAFSQIKAHYRRLCAGDHSLAAGAWDMPDRLAQCVNRVTPDQIV
jgi:transposase